MFLGGGNSDILYVHPGFGEDSHFDESFSKGLVQPPTRSLGLFDTFFASPYVSF